MKKYIMFIIVLASVCIGLPIIYTIANNTSDNKTFTIRNNNTRDYDYEHYCDSLYIVNPDYYFDVLVETDEFQDYIEEHGEWWTN